MASLRKFLTLVLLLALVLPGAMPALAAPVKPAEQAGPPCYLLDDPSVRARMSAPFEEALLQVCGRAPAPVAPAPGYDPPLAGGIQAGPDVRVSSINPPGGASDVQSETSIAVSEDTGTICSSWNDRYHWYVEGSSYIGFSRSTDGGQTFSADQSMPQYSGGQARGDPSVIWRAADGNFYFTSIFLTSGGSMQLGFWRSSDDCATFQWVGLVHAGYSDDKELMAVDNNPSSPHYGRLYVTWMDFGGGGLSLTYSDNGTNWSTPLVLSSDNVQAPWPAVAPNGDVYVAWLGWGYSENYMEVARSTNGGQSFTRVADAASGVTNPYDDQATNNCGRDALKANADDGIRYLPSPQIVVGPDGCLHVVYSYDPDGHGVGDVVDSFYRRSCNNGASWEAEHRLNDDTTDTDQFFPAVTVNANNVVAASWYDRRLDPTNNWYFDRYMAISTDGGTTWLPNQRVSDVSSPVWIDGLSAYCYHGDYDQMAATSTSIYVQWSDDRNMYSGHNDSDIFLDQEALSCDPVTDAEFSWAPLDPIATQPLTLTGVATGTMPISYEWDLGDGTGAAGPVVNHSYDLPGSYTVVMTATNCSTETFVVSHVIQVAACEPVVGADFGWAPLLPAIDENVTFTGYSWAAVGDNWLTATIDSAGTVGAYNSLVLDAAGRPHISYYDTTNGDLKYAYYDGMTWQVQAVDSAGNVGLDTSLALDAAGWPHISYYDQTNRAVKYAWYDGASWTSEVVESIGDGETSLVLDSDGTPHISYGGTAGLHYATYDGSAWQTAVVDSTGGSSTSIQLDSAHRPHISYVCNCTDLRHAWFNGTSWTHQTIEDVATSSGGTSLALDAADRPSIAYYQGATQDLKYARYDGSSWQKETVEVTGTVGQGPSLVLDAAARPRVSYFDQTDGDLHYASKDGGTWQVAAIASAGTVGQDSSLYAQDSGQLCISYSDVTSGDLVYGCQVGDPTPPVDYSWDLGDDATATGPVVDHSYALPGAYTVVLTASNCGGAVATASHVVTVTAPSIAVSAVPTVTLYPSLTASRTLVISNTGDSTLTWTLAENPAVPWLAEAPTGGQVTAGDAAAVTLNYTAPTTPGRRTTQLRITSNDPFRPQVSAPIVLVVLEPCDPVEILAVTTAVTNCQVSFGAELTGTAPYSYSWNFGPLGTSTMPAPLIDFGGSGLFPYTLTVANCMGTSTDMVTGTVAVECCVAPVEILTITTAISGSQVTFEAELTGTAPYSYSWDFGALGTSSSASPQVDFGQDGVYPYTLTVENCLGTDVMTGAVTIASCVPVEILSITQSIAGCQVAFGAELAGTAPYSYSWDFGALGSSSSASPQVDLLTSGTYSGTLEVWNCGGAGYAMQPFSVTVSCEGRTWAVYLPVVVRGYGGK